MLAFINVWGFRVTHKFIIVGPAGGKKEEVSFSLIKAKHFNGTTVRWARALTASGLSLKGLCEKRSNKYYLIPLLISALNFISSSLPQPLHLSYEIKRLLSFISCLWVWWSLLRRSIQLARDPRWTDHQHILFKDVMVMELVFLVWVFDEPIELGRDWPPTASY